MKQKWILFGCGFIFGDIYDAILENNGTVEQIVMNMDVDEKILNLIPKSVKVIKMEEFFPIEDVNYFFGFMDPKKDLLIEQLKSFNLSFSNVVHPKAVISTSAKIGEGNFIAAGAVIASNVTIGSHNHINRTSSIGHDTVVGDFNRIAPGATICALNKIGNKNLLGANSTINPEIEVGDNITIGSGGVVIDSILESGTYVGVPVKLI